MRGKRRTEFTIETHRVFVIRRQDGGEAGADGWCAQCAAGTPMVAPEAAALMASVGTRTIYRWVEAGLLHYAETPGGFLLVCVGSLLAGDSNQPRQILTQ